MSIIYLFNACTEVIVDNNNPVDTSWGPVSKYFVNAYIEPKLKDTIVGYNIDTVDDSRISSFQLENPILELIVGFNTPEEDVIRERLYPEELWYPQEKVDHFKELAIKNRDTSFNRDGSFGSCLVDPVKSINIVSDADYDDAHPAGTSLNDIIYIVFRSATEFVESNYTDEKYDTKKHPYDLHFIEPLDQFLEKKRNLVDGFFEFIFHHLPTKALTHNFTVYYDDTAGRHFEIPVKSVSVEKEIIE
jgi:hypothetical protein